MLKEQVRAITMLFPDDLASQQWLESLALILKELPDSQVAPGKITLAATQPDKALPVIELIQAPVAYPELVFELDQDFELSIGDFRLSNHPVFSEKSAVPEGFGTIERLEDNNGSYLRIKHANKCDFKNLLALEQLYARLKGHLVRADHFGVNLPVSLVDRPEWTELLNKLAGQTNLYRYPEGFEWPFILPATGQEFETEIKSFVAGRHPRFELVYDEYLQYPLYQFALVTDLTKGELEKRFPAPYGMAISGLDSILRSVFIFHPWPGLGVRFDLYYAGDGSLDNWQSGEWLVRQGGRISPEQ
ncbi:MAG: hypothetical protein JWP00_1837 [Chloroflexi bacterium]|jgi:hypothetical protein|nr:hypothetical protein [Chloroflexota bacterium]